MVDGLLDEPAAMREIHAIRAQLYEETKRMTHREKTDFFNREAAEMAEKCGLTHKKQRRKSLAHA